MMSNVPKLRFKEFSGEWKKSLLGKYGNLINGLTYSPDNITDNGLLVLRSSNIQNNQISYEDNVYVNLSVKDEALTKENDILICVRNGSKKLIGKNVLIPASIPNSTHGAFMTIFRGDSNKFVAQWFNCEMFFKQVHMNLGATINSINGSDLKKFKVIFPDKQEQEKIASFLTSVDVKIEQLTKKEELLSSYKKGVMQKIFSGEIRFKADDGSEFYEWEEKKLDDVLTTVSTRLYQIKSSDILENGTYKVIDQGQKAVAGYSNDKDKVYTDGEIIVYGDHTTIVKYIDFDFIVGADGTKLLTTSPSNNLKYMYYNLIHNNIEPEGYKRHFSILRGVELQIPFFEEQTKIANFLSSIDAKIEQVQKQLNSIKEFKKALLQQMFV